ncbi:MAG TPA: hypothetical protein VK446_11995, partial [Methylocystis sp.]|nr:hypothetical protein [Methylocystis sp.]
MARIHGKSTPYTSFGGRKTRSNLSLIDQRTSGRRMQNSSSPLALEIRGLVKSFERPAVDRLDLSVPAGEFYTLLGP